MYKNKPVYICTVYIYKYKSETSRRLFRENRIAFLRLVIDFHTYRGLTKLSHAKNIQYCAPLASDLFILRI